MSYPWEAVVDNLPTALEVANIPAGMLRQTTVDDETDETVVEIVPLEFNADPADVEH